MSWLDKPDGDGLWWRCDYGCVTLCVVKGNRYGFALFSDGNSCVDSHAYSLDSDKSKWQRCELTKPEPYQPPKPPKVEWFTGWRKGVFCYIALIGERYIATNEKGESFSGVWYGVGEHDFATVRKMESPP